MSGGSRQENTSSGTWTLKFVLLRFGIRNIFYRYHQDLWFKRAFYSSKGAHYVELSSLLFSGKFKLVIKIGNLYP